MNEQQDTSAPIEGVVTTAEPRCTRHDTASWHGFNPHPHGLPAHMWDGPTSTGRGCLTCGQPFEKGDRYLCDEGGIVHVSCVSHTHTDAAEIKATR